jgi:glycerol-3-phosphate dehydrogenase
MAEDCVNQAATLARLPEKPCVTAHLNIHGFHKHADKFGHLAVYGADAPAIQDLMRADESLGERLHPALPYCGAEVLWAARFEMARTVEDFLARRTRALFLNARAAVAMAPTVAALLGAELRLDQRWQEEQVRAFQDLARDIRCKTTVWGLRKATIARPRARPRTWPRQVRCPYGMPVDRATTRQVVRTLG